MDIIEIYFENVNLFESIDFVFANLEFIENYNCSSGDYLNMSERNEVFSLINSKIGTSTCFNLKKITMCDVYFERISIQIYHYESNFELIVLFDQADMYFPESENFVEEIYKISKKLAKVIGSHSFFAGIEPAMDQVNRFFDEKNQTTQFYS